MKNNNDCQLQVGMVVNYYCEPHFTPAIKYTTLLSLQLLRQNENVETILLVDGSTQPDLMMAGYCRSMGVTYHHAGRSLQFAEGFNVGLAMLNEPFIGLMANDIFPPADTVKKLLSILSISDVGCVFPYLSYCDYPGQMYDFVHRAVTCEPTIMTLNLNLFKREVLEKAGGVNESYSGSYNDLILLMKIRQMGYRVVLVGDTRVTHLGQMTISQGTTYKKEKDRQRFIIEYPNYVSKHGAWQVAHWKRPLATNKLVSFLWWLCQNTISTRVRNALQNILIMYEPVLTRFPASWDRQYTQLDSRGRI